MAKLAWGIAAAIGIAAPSFAADQCKIATIAELPVTMRGLSPTVPLTINGKPATFTIDTGAYASIVSPAAAIELGLRDVPVQRGFDNPYEAEGVGGRIDLKMVQARTIAFGGLKGQNVELLVGGTDFGQAGVIGRGLLRWGDPEFDLAHGMLRMIKPIGCGNAALAYWSGDKPVSILPISPVDPRAAGTIVTVQVNGIVMRALLDSGASLTTLTVSAAARAGIHPDDKGVAEAGYARGGGQKFSRQWIARFDSVKIGDEEIKHTKLRFGDLGSMDFDMLLGADFLLSHRVLIATSQNRVYFTYEGGPVFRLDSTPAIATPGGGTPVAGAGSAPTSVPPDALARAASAKTARNDLAGAVADLTRAIEAAPKEGTYRVQRAALYLNLKRADEALADFDAAIALRPDDVEARLARARLLIRADRSKEARAELDAVAKSLNTISDQRLELADLYLATDAFAAAIAQYDVWIAAHAVDPRLAEGRNQRCWARALAATQLAKAMDDCNAAVRMMPRSATMLDSRGLVRLRTGDLAGAITDYDAALASNPRKSWSLYGRGLAELRSGRELQGRKDIADALAITPKLTDQARRYGIIPADGEPR